MTVDSPAIPSPRRRWSTVGWWALTLLTLVILDDLTFGPVFWLISRLGSPLAGFLAALVIYVSVQLFIVWRGTREVPGRVATFFLDRLDLKRRSQNVAERERALRTKVTGTASAVALSFVIGGVLPPMLLWRAGATRTFVRALAVVTSTIYAVLFALVHGLVPGLL